MNDSTDTLTPSPPVTVLSHHQPLPVGPVLTTGNFGSCPLPSASVTAASAAVDTPPVDASPSNFVSGKLNFVIHEVEHSYDQKYLRVPANANPADIVVFMRDVWHLQCPMIVLSLLTGRVTEKMWQSKKTVNAFKGGIKNAAINTDMWVLTHGFNYGVTRVIGEAYDEEQNSRARELGEGHHSLKRSRRDPDLPLVLIGICDMSSLHNAKIFDTKTSEVAYTVMGGQKLSNQTELEPHHTHYILIDDRVDHNKPNIDKHDSTTTTRPSNQAGIPSIRTQIEQILVQAETFRTGRFTTSRAPFDYSMGGLAGSLKTTPLHIDGSDTMPIGLSRPEVTTDSDSLTLSSVIGVPGSVSSIVAPPDPVTAIEGQRTKDVIKDVVPVICLVVGGGLTTLKDVAEKVKLDIPVSLCKGSGFAADLLAYAYEELSDDSDSEMECTVIRPEIGRRLIDTFPNTEQQVVEECTWSVIQIVNKCSAKRIHVSQFSSEPAILKPQRGTNSRTNAVLTIFDTRNWTTDPTRLHKELLLTLLKCQRTRRKAPQAMTREQVYRQLQLLLDWNVPELAQMEVFDKEGVPKYAIPVHIFEQAIIRRQREPFIELFLDRDFQIQRFFTRNRIRRWISLNESDFFKDVCVDQLLGGKESVENYGSHEDISPLLNKLVERLTGLERIFRPIDVHSNLRRKELLRLVTPETQTFTALTLLAVLMNRHDLARVLLKRSECPIPVALFCSMLYRRLSHFCREPFMKRKVKEQSTEMATYAVGIVDLCFQKSDYCSPSEILNQPNPDFNDLTTIQIAYKAKVMEFIAHPLCQRWINENYYASLRFRNISFGPCRLSIMIKVLLSAVFMVPSIWWVRLDKIEELTKNKKKKTDAACLVKQAQQHRKEQIPTDPGGHNKVTDDHTNDEQKQDGSSSIAHEDAASNTEQKPPSFLEKKVFILQRLWGAPITKFYLNFLSYLVFLGTLGLAALWPACGNLLLDSFICIWATMITFELARCTYITYTLSDGHMPIQFNIIDITIQIAFLIAFTCTRLVGNWNGTASVTTGKFVLCLGLLYYTYRVPFIYMAISETLGPQLVWIRYTITHDFADFTKLLLLAIFAGGITMNSVLYPYWPLNSTMETIERVFIRAFLAIFLTEKADLETKPQESCRSPSLCSKECLHQSAGTSSIFSIGRYHVNNEMYKLQNVSVSCPSASAKAWLFAILHFILMKLFLITILYAMFNNSSLSISKYSSLVWMFKRYENIMAFKFTSTLPPPLSIFYYMYKILCCILQHCCKCLDPNKQRNKKLDGESWMMSLRGIVNSYRGRDVDDLESVVQANQMGLGQIDSKSTTAKPANRPVVTRKLNKDTNYWRLLAQEYITNCEEGKSTPGASAESDSMAAVRKRLMGTDTSDSLTNSRQLEGIKTQLTQTKEQMTAQERIIEKVLERLTGMQEDFARVNEKLAKGAYAESDQHSASGQVDSVAKPQTLLRTYLFVDTYESVCRNANWNDIDTATLQDDTELVIDRRSWVGNPETGLPIIYPINQTQNLPIWPLTTDVENQSTDKLLPLYGPNHEFRIMFVDTSSKPIKCWTIDGLQIPVVSEQGLTNHTGSFVIKMLQPFRRIVSNETHYTPDMPTSVVNGILRLWNARPVFRGLVLDDPRNRWNSWVEAEFWLVDFSDDWKLEDGSWELGLRILPRQAVSTIESILDTQTMMLRSSSSRNSLDGTSVLLNV